MFPIFLKYTIKQERYLTVWKCSLLNKENINSPLHSKAKTSVNPVPLFGFYNKKAQRFCREQQKMHTQRHKRMRKSTKEAAVTAGREGTLGTVLQAARCLECFARHQASLEQMFLVHLRGLGTTHACLPACLGKEVLLD